jgi:hypothetical protein
MSAQSGSVSASPEEVFSLHRYFLAANAQRVAFQQIITGHAEKTGEAPHYGGENWNENWIAMSYWYGGLYVVIEGWQELGLIDPEVDALLASPNVALLKRYRNGTFHYQRKYFDERFQGLIRDGTDVVAWVTELNQQFGRFFLEWFARIEGDSTGGRAPDLG